MHTLDTIHILTIHTYICTIHIGFITFDAHIHFYNLSAKLTSPHMLVVSDITDVILPLPEDILVNLSDSRAVVEAFLDSLPTMFKTSSSTSACTGKGCSLLYGFYVVCTVVYMGFM